jgi:hypothetical protein
MHNNQQLQIVYITGNQILSLDKSRINFGQKDGEQINCFYLKKYRSYNVSVFWNESI